MTGAATRYFEGAESLSGLGLDGKQGFILEVIWQKRVMKTWVKILKVGQKILVPIAS